MKRRFAWLLGLTLVVNPAWSQEKTELPRPETPRLEFKAPAPTPVVIQPVTEAFVAAPQRANVSASFDYLLWWYKRDQIPSLLNTAPETNTLFAGTALDPNATSVYGTEQHDFGAVSGLRASIAVAMTANVDLEIGGFLMESSSTGDSFSGISGQPFLTRPFYNVHDIVEAGFDTSSMSGISGDLTAIARNQLYGYEANAAFLVNNSERAVQKIIVGFRQVTMAENLTVIENVRANGPGFLAYYPTAGNANFDPATQSIRIVDGFSTRNAFYGPQAGAQFRWNKGALSADFLAKIALGVNRETIRVQGWTNRLTNGVITDVGPGGLLAVSTNSGTITNSEIAVVPELGLKLNYEVTRNVNVNFGYSVLYLSSMARPGNQIDRRINPQYVPSDVAYNPATTGPVAPRRFFRDTDFFAQGISFGIVVSY